MGILKDVAGAAAGAGLGMLTDRAAAERQQQMNLELMQAQQKANKEMGRFNQDLAYEMWEKTNFEAQRKEMQKAGLSVGLMYGKGGAGGTTQGGQAQGVSGQSVGMSNSAGMGMMAITQMKNIEANTQKIQAETEKLKGVDTSEATQRIEESKGRMTEISARIKNAETQNEIMQWEKSIKQVEAGYAQQNTETDIAQTKAATEKLVADTKNAVLENQIDSATAKEVIKQAGLESVTMVLQNDMLRQKIINEAANTTETYRKIEKIAEEIIRMQAQTSQGETALSQEQQKILLDKIRTDFNAGDEAKMIRWINTGADAARTIMSGLGKSKAPAAKKE